MRNIRITRTDTGYVLRTCRWVDILLTISLSLVFIMSLTFMLFALVGGGEEAIGTRIACFILGAAMVGLDVLCLYSALGQRITLDGEGVHFGRTLAKTRHIPWRDVRDWGFAHQYVKGSKAYYIYFASVPWKTVDGGMNKRVPLSFRLAAFLGVTPKEIMELRDLGVIAYCRRHLGVDDESAETYVPMFMSEEARAVMRDRAGR